MGIMGKTSGDSGALLFLDIHKNYKCEIGLLVTYIVKYNTQWNSFSSADLWLRKPANLSQKS